MKKLLFCAAMIAAVMFTACGNKTNPEVQKVADMLNAKVAEEGEEISVSANGNDIVFTTTVDESDLPAGMTVKNVIDMYNAGGDAMAKMMVSEMFSSRMDETDREIISVLRDNKSNIIIRIVGKQSGEAGDFTVSYKLLPE